MRSMSLVWPTPARPRATVPGRLAPAPSNGLVSAARAVLRMAAALEPDPLEAMIWYCHVPIVVLDGLTAAALVSRGRAAAVCAFLGAAIEADRAERRQLP